MTSFLGRSLLLLSLLLPGASFAATQNEIIQSEWSTARASTEDFGSDGSCQSQGDCNGGYCSAAGECQSGGYNAPCTHDDQCVSNECYASGTCQ